LQNKKIEGEEISYLEYLTGSKTVSGLERSLSSQGGSFKEYSLTKQHYVMMGMYSEVGVWQWVTGGLIVAGAIIAAPVSAGSSIGGAILLLGAGGGAGHFLGTTVKGDSGYDYLTPVIIEANSREFDVFDCKEVSTIS
jgi:hypothetical protein